MHRQGTAVSVYSPAHAVSKKEKGWGPMKKAKKRLSCLSALVLAVVCLLSAAWFPGFPVTAHAGIGDTYTVSVATGYLALRTAKAYDDSNIIGELYSGDTVTVQDMSDATYWYVYSPKYNCYGYVNCNYIYYSSGGGGYYPTGGSVYTVSVAKGYLALRTAKAYDSRNEIGELYSGDTVTVQDTSDGTYWYVYSPKYGKYGYVNRNYLYYSGGPVYNPNPAPVYTGYGTTYTVSVAKGYLALRTAKAYDSSNEIGELYSGDTVSVQDTSDGTYWYVYSPKYGRYGYVNKNYLYYSGGSAPVSPSYSGTAYTVSVATGYLALRTAKAYDSRNEIGELYSGDVVYLQDASDGTYWYVYSPKLGKYGYVNRNYLY